MCFGSRHSKYQILILACLVIAICSCKRPVDISKTDKDVITNDIRLLLTSLADSVRLRGQAGWLGFLDNMPDFKWSYMGVTIPYDTLVRRIQDRNPQTTFMTWDSISVEALGPNDGRLFAIFTEMLSQWSTVSFSYKLESYLRKTSGRWRFHSVEMSGYDRWQGVPNVAIADTSQALHNQLNDIVRASLGRNHIVTDLLDVDDRTRNAFYRRYQDMGYVFEDPQHQLAHSYLAVVQVCDDSGYVVYDSASVAIIHEGAVAWHSKYLIQAESHCALPGFADLNDDGITDILVGTPADMRGYGEKLWIISPDSVGGRLLNSSDERGQSTVTGATGTFRFNLTATAGPKEIRATDFGEDTQTYQSYVWNGTAFVKGKHGRY